MSRVSTQELTAAVRGEDFAGLTATTLSSGGLIVMSRQASTDSGTSIPVPSRSALITVSISLGMAWAGLILNVLLQPIIPSILRLYEELAIAMSVVSEFIIIGGGANIFLALTVVLGLWPLCSLALLQSLSPLLRSLVLLSGLGALLLSVVAVLAVYLPFVEVVNQLSP